MRKTGAWREALVKDLTAMKTIYGSFPMTAGELLDTELILTMMKEVFPGQDPALAWAVLGGHPLPALDLLSPSAARALLLTRLHLFKLVSRTMWGEYLEQYRSLPSPYPLYRIDGKAIVEREDAVLPERLDDMREALRTPHRGESVKRATLQPGATSSPSSVSGTRSSCLRASSDFPRAPSPGSLNARRNRRPSLSLWKRCGRRRSGWIPMPLVVRSPTNCGARA